MKNQANFHWLLHFNYTVLDTLRHAYWNLTLVFYKVNIVLSCFDSNMIKSKSHGAKHLRLCHWNKETNNKKRLFKSIENTQILQPPIKEIYKITKNHLLNFTCFIMKFFNCHHVSAYLFQILDSSKLWRTNHWRPGFFHALKILKCWNSHFETGVL